MAKDKPITLQEKWEIQGNPFVVEQKGEGKTVADFLAEQEKENKK